MIEFKKLCAEDLPRFQNHLSLCNRRGCEYSFANLCMWGRQRAAFVGDFLVLFSQFDRRSVYPFPLGHGDIKPVLDAIIHDARKRGLPCYLSSMTQEDCTLLEQLYPGQFRFHTDRDNYDYVYRIEDLATLKGKRYQSKRNFANRFWSNHPDAKLLPMDEHTQPLAQQMVEQWFLAKESADPLADFHLEKLALERAFQRREALGLEGLVLVEDGKCIAMTMGSPLSDNTFDIHFEKALDGYDGAYATINQGFARYLLGKHPNVEYLNREDDLGIEGLRKAKLSYHPDHLVEKHWARLWEEDDER